MSASPGGPRNAGLAIEPLWAAEAPAGAGAAAVRGGTPPAELASRFPGRLAVPLRADRPAIVANFVSSVDGVAALGAGQPTAGGSEISGHSEPDRFMMALLRSLADVIVVGAGTVRAGRRHEWTARQLQPDLAAVFATWRARLGLAEHPTTIVVSGRGELDFTHRGLSSPDVPVIVVTTAAGAQRLASGQLPGHVTVMAAAGGAAANGAGGAGGAGGDASVPPAAILDAIRGTGARLALCEGGPHLFGELLRAQLIDELFLTVAPQVVGRTPENRRLSFAEGVDLDNGRWARLQSVRRAGDDLFLRYRFEP
jgi:riboflavin biosynthesis pyrimidine reductase